MWVQMTHNMFKWHVSATKIDRVTTFRLTTNKVRNAIWCC